jgi:protein TonB
MVRHSNSLLISLFIHTTLFLILFFAWKSYSEVKEEEQKKICLKLCTVELSKNAIEPKEAQKAEAVIQKKPTEIKKAEEAKEVKEEKKTEKKIEAAVEIKQVKDEVIADVVSEKPIEIQKPIVEQKKAQNIQNEYDEINKQKIAELIKENLYYPINARKRNITGLVKVSFTLGVDAKVCNIKIVESDSDILSRAATKTIEDLSTKFPKPPKELTLSIPINYNLN